MPDCAPFWAWLKSIADSILMPGGTPANRLAACPVRMRRAG